MKRAVLLLLLVMACQAADSDDYPIAPGGAGPIVVGGGGGPTDAGVGDGGDGDAGAQLTGRVCLLTDLRAVTNLTACDEGVDAKGLIVTLGTRTAITTDRGAFTISAPRGAGFTWRVRGAQEDVIVRSAMPFGTDNTIPVIGFERYRELLSNNSATVGPLQGSVVLRVVRGTVGVPQVTATMAGQDLVLYDGTSLTDWNTGTVGTGTAGVVWIPGVEVPASGQALAVTLSPPGAPLVTTPVVVEDETITFVMTDLLP
jgi:hypothetical protein